MKLKVYACVWGAMARIALVSGILMSIECLITDQALPSWVVWAIGLGCAWWNQDTLLNR